MSPNKRRGKEEMGPVSGIIGRLQRSQMISKTLRLVPWPLIAKPLCLISQLSTLKARKLFEQAGTSPAWLDYDKIEVFQRRYPPTTPTSYDPESLKKRGREHAETVLRIIPSPKKVNTFLELGCWDGMTCFALRHFGKSVVAIDNRTTGFDKRAKGEGVLFAKMDAHHLHFKDEAFDVVFSYSAFEHFANPKAVLQEAIRVVKPGGYIYIEFPIAALSPYGAHLPFFSIPYCKILFSKDSLQKFANSKGVRFLDFDAHNDCTLQDFRKIFFSNSKLLKRVRYMETPVLDKSCIKLIEENPSCFKSKTGNFENFVVSYIRALFKKVQAS